MSTYFIALRFKRKRYQIIKDLKSKKKVGKNYLEDLAYHLSMRYKENISVKEKMHWVAEKVNGLGLYPNVMGKSIAKTEMLEKA